MLIYLENLCCCCSNLVEAVEDLGQSSLKHILDNFVWIIAIVSLPGRILAALRRGRQVSPLAPLFLDCHLCLFNNDIFCLCFFSLFFFIIGLSLWKICIKQNILQITVVDFL